MAVSASPKLDKLLGRQVWLSYFNLSAGYSYFRNVFAGLSYVAVSTHSCISWSEMYVLVILLWTLSTTYTRVYELFHVFFTVGVSWHSIWWSSEFIAISGRSMSWSLHSSSLTCFFFLRVPLVILAGTFRSRHPDGLGFWNGGRDFMRSLLSSGNVTFGSRVEKSLYSYCLFVVLHWELTTTPIFIICSLLQWDRGRDVSLSSFS